MLKILIPLLFLIFLLFIVDRMLFGPTGASKETDIFVVPQGKEDFDIAQALKEENFIKSEGAFQLLINFFAKEEEIKPGGYRLYTKMNARQILTKITGKQDLFWVTVSSCPRKEQVGEKLAEALGWDKEKLEKWNALYKDTKPDYFEGVYYPDTYLIPTDESEVQIAERFINRFNEKFAPLADKFVEKNIKWTTGLKIASLIAREAAGTEDMGLISGIIWNRLLKNMPLQIDATMQYTLGKNINGSWWGGINLTEKQNDSPYNSYLYKGLPPTPICSPNIEIIEAVLSPEKTDCLYYLHDIYKEIHCAKTYKDHKANIGKYLRL
ncbi:MAG: endolytic transglycosylase MltG [bacterium]|nr:endolytic transglycosylase MltG [bacterium]